MTDAYEVRFTVKLPDDCSAATTEEVTEWLRFCLHDRCDMSGANPLVRYDPEPVRGTFMVWKKTCSPPPKSPHC